MKSEIPLVYSCSGCSSAAQMANSLALRLDRDEIAEMSCIAGVGGGVAPLVRVAKSGREIIALDGCAFECTRHCLLRHEIEPNVHIVLSDLGVKKRKKHLFTASEIGTIYRELKNRLNAV